MKAIRIGICVLLAFSVLAHGAVEPWSEAVLEIGAAVLFVWWGLLFAVGGVTILRWNWLLGPVAGLWAFAVAQYFMRLSAAPVLTENAILKFAALGILLFLAVQAYETLEQWQGFVWFVLLLGFGVSVFGILQHFTFNGKLYWLRELRYGGVPFGPYVNRDHFSGLIELIVPVGLALILLRAEERDRTPLLAILTLLPIGALFLAASRGGIVSFFLEVVVVVVLVFSRRRSGNQRFRNQFVAGAAVLVLASALVAWLGIEPALDRFASFRQLEVTESRRTEMAKDSLRIFFDHPVFGTGLGTLVEVFPRYETLYDGKIVDHSHNDYVEALAETGLIGGGLCAAFLVLLFCQTWARLAEAKNTLDLAFHIGALAGCCGLLNPLSLVDFQPPHIPSNALLFLLEAGLATSRIPSNRQTSRFCQRRCKNPQKCRLKIPRP